jgi:hypothetical protein
MNWRDPQNLLKGAWQTLPRLFQDPAPDTMPLGPPPVTHIDIDLDDLEQSALQALWSQFALRDDEDGWTTQPAVSHQERPRGSS